MRNTVAEFESDVKASQATLVASLSLMSRSQECQRSPFYIAHTSTRSTDR